MSCVNKPISEIETWLKQIFDSKNFQNPKFTLLGNSEKGDGYLGDILFVELSGVTEERTTKKYDLALKCSKNSLAVREKNPIKDAFLCEIYVYTKIFPVFQKFQQEKNVSKPFHRVPKCYGTLVKNHLEVIALENLKTRGYFLWDARKPLTRRQTYLIVEEYARFHAISLAMKDQEPAKFEELVEGLDDVFLKFFEQTDLEASFINSLSKIYSLFKEDFEKNVLEKVYNLKLEVESFVKTTVPFSKAVKVICHGDCWNNNFLHCVIDNQPTFAMLDWQLSRYASPALDLSYFLFTTASSEVLEDLPAILQFYHKSLSDQLNELGSDVNRLYPFEEFLKAWHEYGKWGIIVGGFILQICYTEKVDVADISKTAEKGESISNAFDVLLPNSAEFKERVKYVINSAVKNNVI